MDKAGLESFLKGLFSAIYVFGDASIVRIDEVYAAVPIDVAALSQRRRVAIMRGTVLRRRV